MGHGSAQRTPQLGPVQGMLQYAHESFEVLRECARLDAQHWLQQQLACQQLAYVLLWLPATAAAVHRMLHVSQ